MGLPNEVNSALIGAAAAGGYEIEQSLRFSGDEFISRANPSSTATSRQTFTHSFWVKRGSLGSTQQLAYWIQGGLAQQTFIAFDSSDRLNVFYEGSDGTSVGHSYSTARYRDPSAWYHIVWATDTTQSTSTNRWKLWVNGEQVTTWDSVAYPSQNLILPTNDVSGGRGFAHGTRYGNEDQLFSGYIAESYFVDGQFLDQNDFGEYNNDGVWVPIQYSGTYGARGWYLPFAASDIYSDESGNNQDFSSFTGYFHDTSGTGTDVMSDTPTNNFATFNPLINNIGVVDGNLRINSGHGSQDRVWPATVAANQSGNYYWEYTITSASNDYYFGVLEMNPGIKSSIWADSLYNFLAYLPTSGNTQWRIRNTYVNSNAPAGGFSVSTNDVIGVRLDIDNDLITISQNGTVRTGVSGVLSSDPSIYYAPAANFYGTNDTGLFNAGQRSFSHQPSGTTALSTAELPTPDVVKSSNHFKTVLYSGDGQTSQAITGVGFQPDFVWIKNRGAGNNGMLQDVVRGANEALVSAYSVGETLNSGNGHVDSFDSDGFTVGWDGANNGGDTNASGNSYVAWCWKAGGSASSNTAGTITSTVSANPTAGFSVVGYTAANAVRTVGHGLGVKPALIIVKDRDASQNWAVYHGSLGATKGLYLDLSTKQETNSGYWNNTEPTSTVFTVGTNTRTGGSTNDFIAYCFAEIEGHSKIGTYTGNGSSDGPFVYLGFRPAMILLKNYAGGSETSWILMDSVRDTYNVAHEAHRPNEPDQDVTSSLPNTDFLSNGFKIRTSWADMNENNSLFAYFAIAENPFGGSGVTPATAR